jgi:hypothetical protein
LKHIPAIADVDNNGSVDVVYRGLDGRVYVQNFGAKSGAQISWATHRGNMRRDGNMGRRLLQNPPVASAVIRSREGNLIGNGGFEENENSHWDKWFSGDIPWSRMIASGDAPHSGARSMEIKLVNDGSQSSITQFSHYGIPESYLKTTPGRLYSFGGFVRSGGLSAASEHWFEWDSSRTGEHPEARPPLPWPSYFTPSAKFGGAAAPWMYLNRVFTMPAGFWNAELRHRFRVEGRATGSVFLDDVFFVELPLAGDNRWREVMAFGERWRYFENTPPADWFAVGFNDAGWPEGQAKFGAGTGPQNIRTAVAAKKPVYYFRRSFTTATTNFSTLLMAATATDDYGGTVYPMRMWVNGVEIYGPIHAVTGEGNEVKYFDLTPFMHVLKAGQPNVIAVSLGNTWQTDWDNVAFDVAMRGIAGAEVPKFGSIARDGAGAVVLRMTGPPNSSWTLESTESLTSPWKVVQTVNFDASGLAVVTDVGQNGRTHPASVPVRFYRLRQG